MTFANSGRAPRSQLPSDVGVVEPHRSLPNHLIALVAFSRDQHGVTRACFAQSPLDRFRAVGNDVCAAGVFEPIKDVVRDLQRRFVTRIVASNDPQVRITFGDMSQCRTLLAILPSGGSVNADQSAGRNLLEACSAAANVVGV